jgi:beta-galactosidase beta subunit
LLEEEQQRKPEGLSTDSLIERLKVLTNMMHKTQSSKKEQFEQHNKICFIDLDSSVNGLPKITLSGETRSTFKTPYQLGFVAVKDGFKHSLGGLTII